MKRSSILMVGSQSQKYKYTHFAKRHQQERVTINLAQIESRVKHKVKEIMADQYYVVLFFTFAVAFWEQLNNCNLSIWAFLSQNFLFAAAYYSPRYLQEPQLALGQLIFLTVLLLACQEVFGVIKDHETSFLFLLYSLNLAHRKAPKVDADSNSPDLVKHQQQQTKLIIQVLRGILLVYFNSNSLFTFCAALYTTLILEYYKSRTQRHLAKKAKDLEAKLAAQSTETAKWKGLVEKFPLGIVLINKYRCLYTNQSLNSLLMTTNPQEAVNKVLQWCLKGEPCNPPENTQQAKATCFNGGGGACYRASNKNQSSPIDRYSTDHQEKQCFGSGIKIPNSAIYGEGRKSIMRYKERHQNASQTRQENSLTLEQHSQLDLSDVSDYGKTFLYLQQALLFTTQMIYLSKSTFKVSQSQNNIVFIDQQQNSPPTHNQSRKNSNLESFSVSALSNNGDQSEKKDFEVQTSQIVWGEEDCILLIVKDVTEMKNYAKLKMQNKYKSMALCTLSHELRTPVHNILNSLANIKERIGNKDPTLLMFHKISTSSGVILFHKINDILDYPLIVQKKLQIEVCSHDVKQIVIDVVEAFEYQIRLKQLNFQCYFEQDLPEAISSDPNRIKQVLFNLVQNALKFTSKGYIRIYVYTEELQREIGKQRYIVFEVEDTGCGIRKQEIPHLYQLFGINKINKEKKNVGLGLTISFLLTQKLGQALHVDSVYGQGTCMSFKIKDRVTLTNLVHSPRTRPNEEISKDSEDLMKITQNKLHNNNFKRLTLQVNKPMPHLAFNFNFDSVHQESRVINCKLYECIANDKIQDKQSEVNSNRMIKVIQTFSTTRNQDLSRMIKEQVQHEDLQKEIKISIKNDNSQWLGGSNENSQSQHKILDSKARPGGQQSSAAGEESKSCELIGSYQSPKKEQEAQQHLEFIAESSQAMAGLPPLGQAKARSRSIIVPKNPSAAHLQVPLQKLSTLGKKSVIQEQDNQEELQGDDQPSSQKTRKHFPTMSKSNQNQAYQQQPFQKLSQKRIMNDIIKHKGTVCVLQKPILASIKAISGEHMPAIGTGNLMKPHVPESFFFNGKQTFSLYDNMNINAADNPEQLQKSLQALMHPMSCDKHIPHYVQQENLNSFIKNPTPPPQPSDHILVTDTEMNVTEFNEDEQSIKRGNFDRFLYLFTEDKEFKQVSSSKKALLQVFDQPVNEESKEEDLSSRPCRKQQQQCYTQGFALNLQSLMEPSKEEQQVGRPEEEVSMSQIRKNEKDSSSFSKKRKVIPKIKILGLLEEDKEGEQQQQQQTPELIVKGNQFNEVKPFSFYNLQPMVNSVVPSLYQQQQQNSPMMPSGTHQAFLNFNSLYGGQNLSPTKINKGAGLEIRHLNQASNIFSGGNKSGESAQQNPSCYGGQIGGNKSYRTQQINKSDMDILSPKNQNSFRKIEPNEIAMEEESNKNAVEQLENMQKKHIEDMLISLGSQIKEQRSECNCPSILIVEDDEFIKIITKTMLLRLGFDINDVGNGALAVECIEEQETKCKACSGYLIILMDYDMPVMNGVEATKKIRSLIGEGKVRDLPIIAVSAFVASQEIERCLNSGMNDYSKLILTSNNFFCISKPFTWQRLYDVLLRWMPMKLESHHTQQDESQMAQN